MKNKNPLKRRAIRRKSDEPPIDYLTPQKSKKTFVNSAIYKYLWGHLVKEIIQQLPAKPVICWYDDHTLSLPVCAVSKFLKEKNYCKKCPLFQEDEYSSILQQSIEKWEVDDIKEDALESLEE